ncbi:hypothetical protein HS088_TW07G00554 [Tripterygium wilfordii]|uniref:Uncharacterized protein n=1 Tax=Tripterygium wilfordii TaxID=458696 RepID=A0A7J7DF72_TRIWF|nr:hypothetical protein HS088_TW07G00554 [Tripterygium wilfordii]
MRIALPQIYQRWKRCVPNDSRRLITSLILMGEASAFKVSKLLFIVKLLHPLHLSKIIVPLLGLRLESHFLGNPVFYIPIRRNLWFPKYGTVKTKKTKLIAI